MNNLTKRKYRFTYGYAFPEKHPECPDFEGEYYVQLSDTDVIEEGETPNEAGFLVVAMDRFVEERNTMELNETEEYELHSITVAPITGTVEDPSDVLKALMDDYVNEADSMTDLILCWLDEDESHTLTDEEIQTLIEFAGDENYVTVEDIRHMSTHDPMYNVEPYKNAQAMFDVMKELDVGSDHFTERLKYVDRRIEIDTECLNTACGNKETSRYLHRINQLKKYKKMLNMIELIDRVESSDLNERLIMLRLIAEQFGVPIITAEQGNGKESNISSVESVQASAAPGAYGSCKVDGVIAIGETVTFDGIEWIVVNVDKDRYTLMKKTIDKISVFGLSTNYRGSYIADRCEEFQAHMSDAALSMISDKTVQGVTAKVWIATKSMIEEWTDSDNPTNNMHGSVRMWDFQDTTIDAKKNGSYWCPDPSDSSYVWYVNCGGYFLNYIPSDARGFRPCIEVIRRDEHVSDVV